MAPHLVAAFDHGHGVVLGAARDRSEGQLNPSGGDYVPAVKNNQPNPYAVCKALPWSQVPARRTTATGHRPRLD